MDASRDNWTLRMDRRVRVTGTLRTESGLHVGSGSGSSQTDATVLRHADGRPYIPGSSLKGAFRSRVARLAQAPALKEAGATSCLLYADDPDATTAPDCPSPGWIDSGKDATEATEEDFGELCHTCTLFGSPILAGKIRIPDLDVTDGTRRRQGEIRDGVGIDRDRGNAVEEESIKFDYEVVPVGTTFGFSLAVENPGPTELGLLAAGIREMQRGHLAIGGKTTRGLGTCVLEDLSIENADFSSAEALSDYLQKGGGKNGKVEDPDAFLDRCIEALFED
ncbi:MAG: CRISPR-associated RAMP protein Csx7 [Salinibacter sp.]